MFLLLQVVPTDLVGVQVQLEAAGIGTNALVNQFCLIGAVILIATGLGLGLGKRIRAADFIPAYLIPVVYGLVMLLVNKLVEAA